MEQKGAARSKLSPYPRLSNIIRLSAASARPRVAQGGGGHVTISRLTCQIQHVMAGHDFIDWRATHSPFLVPWRIRINAVLFNAEEVDDGS
jgi:hypothetical protein